MKNLKGAFSVKDEAVWIQPLIFQASKSRVLLEVKDGVQK